MDLITHRHPFHTRKMSRYEKEASAKNWETGTYATFVADNVANTGKNMRGFKACQSQKLFNKKCWKNRRLSPISQLWK